ncbi:hypothetical protein B0H34DRAFT_676340 [Crassisporium funariophilum]|nr:hypothetical protein B0H34DRAFT_676340 [Crassisporium funariophilum]
MFVNQCNLCYVSDTPIGRVHSNQFNNKEERPGLDKVRSRFAFPALCWEKSFIPLDIWNAGDLTSNLIESVHADVNREGVGCTLIGVVKKGQAFDVMKMEGLKTLENAGIRFSYSSGHLSENSSKSIKQKFTVHHNQLSREDSKIEHQNKKRAVDATKSLARSGSGKVSLLLPSTYVIANGDDNNELNKSD